MSQSTYRLGGYHAGERQVTFFPRQRYNSTLRRGIVFCHGASTDARRVKGINGFGLPKILRRVVDAGYPLFAADLGSSLTNWGNSEAMSRMDEAYTYVHSTLGFRSGKVHILAESAGAVVALRWAITNPTQVASIAALLPAYDMQAIRDNASGTPSNVTVRGQIDAAWGVTYPAALPAGANPPENIAPIVGVVPYVCWYTSDDVPELVDDALNSAADLGGTATSLGALGHTDAAMGTIPYADLVTFFNTAD